MWFLTGFGGFIKQGSTKVISKQVAKNSIKATSGKIFWGSWDDYAKVIVGEEEFGVVGNGLYTKHAVNRMQPSANKYGSRIVQAGGDYGRGVPPSFMEYVLQNLSGKLQPNGNLSYISDTLQVIVNEFGTIITK
ncbi:hypothetical protein ACFSTH_07060 [Paenibacillus yanchengensis]|uniref:Uncharacterized protein n=1 Tax=Paenibacillus yanchengensis TaxID=2035833 RepID=A0ABW4YHV5_9BACL